MKKSNTLGMKRTKYIPATIEKMAINSKEQGKRLTKRNALKNTEYDLMKGVSVKINLLDLPKAPKMIM